MLLQHLVIDRVSRLLCSPDDHDLGGVAVAPGALSQELIDPGRYRVVDDVALLDSDGGSRISGADFALAVVDEIEADTQYREYIGIAY